MIPDLWSSRGESKTSKIGFYPLLSFVTTPREGYVPPGGLIAIDSHAAFIRVMKTTHAVFNLYAWLKCKTGGPEELCGLGVPCH